MSRYEAILQEHGVPDVPVSGRHPFLEVLQRLPGRVFVSWTMAGGLVAGGWLVAATTLAGQSSSSMLPQAATLLFCLGMGAGMAHGGLLAYLSRNPARSRREVLGILGRSLVWALPGAGISLVAALWISLTATVIRNQDPDLLRVGGVVLAWAFGLLVCGWAAWEGLRGILAAYRRWPDMRVASLVISAVFAVLVTVFLNSPPEVWFTHLKLTSTGSVLLAFGASVWVALPVVIAALHLWHRFTRS